MVRYTCNHRAVRRLYLLVSATSSQVKTFIKTNELLRYADQYLKDQTLIDSLDLDASLDSLDSYLAILNRAVFLSPRRDFFRNADERHAFDSLLNATALLVSLPSQLQACRSAAVEEERMLQRGLDVGRVGIPNVPAWLALKKAAKELKRLRDGYRVGHHGVPGWKHGLSAHT